MVRGMNKLVLFHGILFRDQPRLGEGWVLFATLKIKLWRASLLMVMDFRRKKTGRVARFFEAP